MTDEIKVKGRQGFASMDPERRREIARKGGSAVAGSDRSFAKNRALAASAGRLGGKAPRKSYKTKVIVKE